MTGESYARFAFVDGVSRSRNAGDRQSNAWSGCARSRVGSSIVSPAIPVATASIV